MTGDQEILGLEDRRCGAMIARDFATLDKLVHEELPYTHSSGLTDTKASWLGSMKSGNVKCFFADVALVRGKAAIEAEIGGQPRSLKLLFLNAWVRTPQGWKFCAWQSCPQPA